jgi:hypothetical protein
MFEYLTICARFEVSRMLMLRIQVVCIVILGSRVIDSHCFKGTYYLHLQGSTNARRILLRLPDP